MLKKILAITLVVTMVFAFTGCDTFGKAFDTLGDLLNGERENEKDMADGELDEEYHFSYIGPDGEIGELPDGEFYFQFETDEEGNMIGKIEISREEVEEDEPVKKEESTKKEEPSKNNNVAPNQRSIISHIGLPKAEIEQLYGKDLTLDEYGALSYKDGRIPLRFYFTGSGNPENLSAGATVSCVAVKGGTYPICSFLTGNETAVEVISKGGYLCGSQGSLWLANGSETFVLYDGQNMNGAELVCMHADDEGVLCNFNYYWKNGSDCDKKAADLIIVG